MTSASPKDGCMRAAFVQYRATLLWLCAALGLAAILFSAAGFVPLTYTLPQEDNLDIRAEGVTPEERGDGRIFRWFHSYAYIDLPGLNSTDQRLSMLVHDAGSPPRQLQMTMNHVQLFAGTLRPGWQRLELLVPAAAISNTGVTRLEFEIPPAKAGSILGLAVAEVSLVQSRPTPLAPGTLVQGMVCALLIGLVLLVSGLALRSATIGFVLACGPLALALALWRVPTAAALPVLQETLLIACWFVLGCRLVLARVWQSQQPWLGQAVALAAALYVLHAAGMHMFRFIEIDHLARANHLANIAIGNGEQVQARLSNQYEWGISVVPYSLWSYYLLLPLTLWFPDPVALNSALKHAVSLIDATTLLLVYALAQLLGGTQRASWYAALLFAALPLTHLYFHDGSYPTIIGNWFVALALVGVVKQGWQASGHYRFGRLLVAILLVTAGMLMYVTNAVFLPVVIGIAGLFATPLARGNREPLLLRYLLISAGAVVLALLLYYGRFVLPMLAALIERLQDTARLGYDGTLSGPLMGPFWLQAWGHTRVVGLVLAGAGIAAHLRQGHRVGAAIGLGCAVLLVLGAFVDMRFNMWNKHWYFLLPALALFAGHGCADLVQRGRVWQATMTLVLVVLSASSAWAWAARVFLYQWSLWSL